MNHNAKSAISILTHRFGLLPLAERPEGLPCIWVSIGLPEKALGHEALWERVLCPAFTNLARALTHRGSHVSIWQPMWTVEARDSELAVFVITESDPHKVAEAIAAKPAPSDALDAVSGRLA